MRVAVGGFSHETNTFNRAPTDLAALQGPHGQVVRGDELTGAYHGTRTVLGGMLDAGAEEGLDLVPSFFARHPPTTGIITRGALDFAVENLESGIRAAAPDGVLLHLHGAAAAEEVDDPEAMILARIRDLVGPEMPIVVVHDLHANIGPAWADHASAIIGYKTAPHVDFYERGVDGAVMLARLLRGEIQNAVAIEKPAILVKSGLMSVTDTPLAVIKSPMFWLMGRAREIERDPGVHNVTIAAGFGDADVSVAGLTVVVNAQELAVAAGYARELSDMAWRLRRGFLTDLVMAPVEMAVERALHASEWPVMLADEGNNTAGGSPGDGTAILAALADAGWPDAALFIRDEDAVAVAVAAGVGGTVETDVGGKRDTTAGRPVAVRGRVRLLFDGRFVSLERRTPVTMGRTAVVRCGETDLVLTERPTSQTSPQYFRAVGIEPRERRILVVQSAHLFRHAFEAEHIPKLVIEVDTPGITSPNATSFVYHRVRRPIFPLDDMRDGGS
jgi:microcystin degradation protein MlrC